MRSATEFSGFLYHFHGISSHLSQFYQGFYLDFLSRILSIYRYFITDYIFFLVIFSRILSFWAALTRILSIDRKNFTDSIKQFLHGFYQFSAVSTRILSVFSNFCTDSICLPQFSHRFYRCTTTFSQILSIYHNFFTDSIYFPLQACAPRYVYYIFMDRMDPVGMCFSARNNFRQIRAHRPCVESGRRLFQWTNQSNLCSLFLSHSMQRLLCLSVSVYVYVYLGLRPKICVVLAKFFKARAHRNLLHGAQQFCRVFWVFAV